MTAGKDIIHRADKIGQALKASRVERFKSYAYSSDKRVTEGRDTPSQTVMQSFKGIRGG